MQANGVKRRERRWLFAASLVGFGLTVVLWLLAEFVAEHTWWTTLLAYAPPVLMAIPTALLLLLALLLRDRPALIINGIAAVFVWFAVLGFALPWGRAPAKDTPHLRLMTYNIEGGERGTDGLIRQIHDQNPDVLCCQECKGPPGWPDPLPALQSAFPDYRFFRADETMIATRLPVLGEKNMSLMDKLDRRMEEVEVAVAGKPVRIMTVHLSVSTTPETLSSHKGSTPAYLRRTAAVRGVQVDNLLTEARRIDTPTILCGDFNTPPRGIFYRRLKGSFTDAFAARGVGFGWTFRSDIPCLRIDHIFTRQGARPIRAFVPRTKASDHRPLIADIVIE